jgi:phage terminase large subunit
MTEITQSYGFDKFRTTSVFNENMKAYGSGVHLIVNQGGSRSSKTISILQVLFLIAVSSRVPLVISVVSRALPHLKLGAMRDFDNIIQSYPYPMSCKNRTDSIYRIGKSIVEFFGTDQLDKVHGPGRDILFLNEANFIKYDVFDQLYIRTTGCTFIDFNPTRKFWAHDEIAKLNRKQYVFIKSTYLDNELIPDSLIEKIEAKKDKKNWWRVYGMGEIGISEGAIITNWRYMEPGETFPNHLPFGFGLDYGFHPDPDALVKCCIVEREKKMYLQELIYESMQGTKDLTDNMKKFCLPSDMIVAECATPRTNYDLRMHFKGLEPVSKTKTVAEWLRKMQDYEIIITLDSYNLEIELCNYVWDDKRAGIPMDGFDHLISSARYYMMRMARKLRRNW